MLKLIIKKNLYKLSEKQLQGARLSFMQFFLLKLAGFF